MTLYLLQCSIHILYSPKYTKGQKNSLEIWRRGNFEKPLIICGGIFTVQEKAVKMFKKQGNQIIQVLIYRSQDSQRLNIR